MSDGLRTNGRIAIVGASLAGLRAAEALRQEGFTGQLTMIGDEPYEPYDRPPLSKQVLTGWVPADHVALPRLRAIDAEWRLGVAASGLDVNERKVHLADGEEVEFDKLLISTGVRARQWPHPDEAALEGVFVVRTRDDAARLQAWLASGVQRVLVIGAGFTGSEFASVCRSQGMDVTVAERGQGPLVGAMGGVIAAVAGDLQRAHGVDLRTGITVSSLEGDSTGHGKLRRAHLSDGSTVDVDVALVALGSVRNTEWLAGSGLAASPWGVACDAGCRAFDYNGIVTDDVFVAGDVARFPHPLFDYQLIALEHWGNAVAMAQIAAHNMLSPPADRWPHLAVPSFWSIQFEVNIKSVGVPPLADQIMITQGSVKTNHFAAAYGYKGRMIAAVTFNEAKWLPHYERLIDDAAPFPPPPAGFDQPTDAEPVPADFPHPSVPSHHATVAVTGHSPGERHLTFRP